MDRHSHELGLAARLMPTGIPRTDVRERPAMLARVSAVAPVSSSRICPKDLPDALKTRSGVPADYFGAYSRANTQSSNTFSET